MADPSQDGLSASEIIHSENLELKPEEPYKNMTEEKSDKNQASNLRVRRTLRSMGLRQ
jgi:hypothetical protein